MGGDGEGPGEFRDPIEFAALHPDSLAVWDWRLGRVSIFTLDGAFVRSIRLQPAVGNATGQIGTLSSGPPLVLGLHDARLPTGTEFVVQYLQLLRYTRDGSLSDTLATLPYGRVGWVDPETRFVGRPVFEARGTFAVNGNRLYIADGTTPEVQVWSADMVLRRLIRWKPPDRTVHSGDVEAYRRSLLIQASSETMRRMTRRRLSAVPVSKTFPAVAEIAVGPLGRLWVRRYPRPSSGTQTWFQFDAKGAFICAATVSGEITVLQFGEDYILGKTTDALDIEYIELFHLSGRGP
jgi:hypothetical protein